MEVTDKIRITSRLPFLTENTCNVAGLLVYLISSSVISNSERQEILHLPSDYQRYANFYSMIIRKGPKAFGHLLDALNETGNTHVVEELLRDIDPIEEEELITNEINGIEFQLRDPITSFTGRKQEIKKLKIFLQSSERKLTCICGLGGVGKSELARKYVKKYKFKLYDGNAIWINAEEHSTLRESFCTLAMDHLNIKITNVEGKPKDDRTIASDVYRYFHQKKCIFIFDNAESYRKRENPGDGIDTFLPLTRLRNVFFLITTRNSDLVDKSLGNFVELEAFSLQESTDFLQFSLSNVHYEENDVLKLHETLQGLPLTLQQAVAYIKIKDDELKDFGSTRGYTIPDYLQLYEAEAKECLQFGIPENTDDTYTKTTMTTWKITWAKMQEDKGDVGQTALLILSMLAYFVPNDIDVTLFRPLVGFDSMKLMPILQLPKKYSLYSLGNGKINIHRLMQHVIRIHFQVDEKEESILESTLSLLFHDPIVLLNAFKVNNILHAISVWDHSSKYDKLVKMFSKLPWNIAQIMIKEYRNQAAFEFASRSLNRLKEVLDTDEADKHLAYTSDTTLTNFMIGRSLHEMGKNDDAMLVFNEVYDVHKNSPLIGLEHTAALQTRYYIGSVLHDQGKYKDALKWLSDVFLLQKQKLLEDDPEILQTKNHIAKTLHVLGRYDEAIDFYNEVYHAQIQCSRNDPLDALIIKSNIAIVLQDQGKFEESLQICVEIFDVRKQKLGIDHPMTLQSRHNIAFLQNSMGMYEEALNNYEEVYQIQKEIFGSEHAITLNTRHNIATIYMHNCQYYEAQELLSDVVEN